MKPGLLLTGLLSTGLLSTGLIAAALPVAAAWADPSVPPLLPETTLANSPVGTWQVRITTFDCKTLRPNPTFESLLSFDSDGNEIETTSNPMLQPGQRTPAFGTWGFTGFRSVALTTKAYILFPSPTGPIKQGSQIIHHEIHLTSDHRFADVAKLSYYDTSGNPTLAGCAVAVGERL